MILFVSYVDASGLVLLMLFINVVFTLKLVACVELEKYWNVNGQVHTSQHHSYSQSIYISLSASRSLGIHFHPSHIHPIYPNTAQSNDAGISQTIPLTHSSVEKIGTNYVNWNWFDWWSCQIIYPCICDKVDKIFNKFDLHILHKVACLHRLRSVAGVIFVV